MKIIDIDEATEAQINYLVAQKEGLRVVLDGTSLRFPPGQFSEEEIYDPCSNPDQSWPIIEREDISTIRCGEGHRGKWSAEKGQNTSTECTEHQTHDEMFQFQTDFLTYGPTSLVAAMRCHVKPVWPEHLKKYFEVPDELVASDEDRATFSPPEEPPSGLYIRFINGISYWYWYSAVTKTAGPGWRDTIVAMSGGRHMLLRSDPMPEGGKLVNSSGWTKASKKRYCQLVAEMDTNPFQPSHSGDD